MNTQASIDAATTAPETETDTPAMPTCEVCGVRQAIGVCCVPGVPYSAAYCRECLEANAHPWSILVDNTMALGGLSEAADWWKKMVEDTCRLLGKTLDQFNADVDRALAEYQAAALACREESEGGTP
jgi:hypothetical protein